MDLKSTVIEGQQPGPHLLIIAGIHGDEYEPMACVRRLIKAIHPEALRGRVTLVPCVNEPAFLRGERTGEDDLDLARICPGKPDGGPSEQIAHAVSTLIREADYLIDLHTGGRRYDILPLVGYGLVSDQAVLDKQRQMADAFNMPVVWGTTSKLNGRTLSVARDAKVPAIYAEWGGPSPLNTMAVEEYELGCLGVMVTLGMLDRPMPDTETEYVVEDDRDNSGHLQINHPAPATGFFEQAVSLGDTVQKGDLIGHITDHMGEEVHPIHASCAGLVIVIRALPVTHKDEMTAVILEMQPPAGEPVEIVEGA